MTFSNQPITQLLPAASGSTLQLVTFSFILAIVLGIALGIVTALRVYIGFDYAITLFSFFLFSLPSFLMAVLLKTFIALGYNNFLSRPEDPAARLLLIAGVVIGVHHPTGRRRNAASAPARSWSSGGATVGVLAALRRRTGSPPGTRPLRRHPVHPRHRLAVVALLAGLKNRRAWIIAGINVVSRSSLLRAAGAASTSRLRHDRDPGRRDDRRRPRHRLPGRRLRPWPDDAHRRPHRRAQSAAVVLLDRFMRSWCVLRRTPSAGVRSRPSGRRPRGCGGDFWISGIDTYTHLLLPTI